MFIMPVITIWGSSKVTNLKLIRQVGNKEEKQIVIYKTMSIFLTSPVVPLFSSSLETQQGFTSPSQ